MIKKPVPIHRDLIRKRFIYFGTKTIHGENMRSRPKSKSKSQIQIQIQPNMVLKINSKHSKLNGFKRIVYWDNNFIIGINENGEVVKEFNWYLPKEEKIKQLIAVIPLPRR